MRRSGRLRIDFYTVFMIAVGILIIGSGIVTGLRGKVQWSKVGPVEENPTAAWIVGGAIIAFGVLWLVVAPSAIVVTSRSDRALIKQEGRRKGCSVVSIRHDWLSFFRGPFAWEFHPKGCRCYRVVSRCDGKRRIASVLIGRRHWSDSSEQLTWRWYPTPRA